jgi:hypothetical protein
MQRATESEAAIVGTLMMKQSSQQELGEESSSEVVAGIVHEQNSNGAKTIAPRTCRNQGGAQQV